MYIHIYIFIYICIYIYILYIYMYLSIYPGCQRPLHNSFKNSLTETMVFPQKPLKHSWTPTVYIYPYTRVYHLHKYYIPPIEKALVFSSTSTLRGDLGYINIHIWSVWIAIVTHLAFPEINSAFSFHKAVWRWLFLAIHLKRVYIYMYI